MYVEFKIKDTIVLQEVMRDLSLVLAGEKLLGNLSSSADDILSVGTPQWVVYDDDLDASGVICMRSAISDEPTQYKYLLIQSYTASRINFHTCLDWDIGSHTPVSPIGPSTTIYFYQPNTASACTYYMYTNEKCLVATQRGGLYQGERYSNVETHGICIIAEHTRDQPWQGVGSGYPPVGYLSTSLFYVYTTSNLHSSAGRTKRYDGVDILAQSITPMWIGGTAQYWSTDMGEQWNNDGLTSTLYNTLGQEIHLFVPMWFGNGLNYASPLGEFAYNCGLPFLAESGVGELSDVQHAGKTYKALRFSQQSTATMLIPKE